MPKTPPERPWDVLDEAALLWTPEIADRVRATHLRAGLGACSACPTGTPWPCVMVAVAGRVGPGRQPTGCSTKS